MTCAECRSSNRAIQQTFCVYTEFRHLRGQGICSMGTGEMVRGVGDFCSCCETTIANSR